MQGSIRIQHSSDATLIGYRGGAGVAAFALDQEAYVASHPWCNQSCLDLAMQFQKHSVRYALTNKWGTRGQPQAGPADRLSMNTGGLWYLQVAKTYLGEDWYHDQDGEVDNANWILPHWCARMVHGPDGSTGAWWPQRGHYAGDEPFDRWSGWSHQGK